MEGTKAIHLQVGSWEKLSLFFVPALLCATFIGAVLTGDRGLGVMSWIWLLAVILGWRYFWISHRDYATSTVISGSGVEVKSRTGSEFADWRDVRRLEVIREPFFPETVALVGAAGRKILTLPGVYSSTYLIEAFAEKSGTRFPLTIETPGTRPKWMRASMWAVAILAFGLFLLAAIPARLALEASDDTPYQASRLMLQIAFGCLVALCAMAVGFASPSFRRLRTPEYVATEVPEDTFITLRSYSMLAERLRPKRSVFLYREPAAEGYSMVGGIVIGTGVVLILALSAVITRNLFVTLGIAAVLFLVPIFGKLAARIDEVQAPPENCEVVVNEAEAVLIQGGQAIAKMDIEQFCRIVKNDRPWTATPEITVRKWRFWRYIPEAMTAENDSEIG